MAFDPSEPRDGSGKWSAGAGGQAPSERARKAVDWLKSPEAKAAIAKLSAPENIKSAATAALQSALFKVGVNDPHIDQHIEYQVKNFANNIKVTRAHARQLMITALDALAKARR